MVPVSYSLRQLCCCIAPQRESCNAVAAGLYTRRTALGSSGIRTASGTNITILPVLKLTSALLNLVRTPEKSCDLETKGVYWHKAPLFHLEGKQFKTHFQRFWSTEWFALVQEANTLGTYSQGGSSLGALLLQPRQWWSDVLKSQGVPCETVDESGNLNFETAENAVHRQESRLSSEKRLGKNNVACFKPVGANVFEVNPSTKCRTHAEHCRNLLTDPKLIDSMQNFDRVCFETLSAPALCLRTAHHRSTCLGADKMLRYLFLDLDGLGMSWVCFGFWAYASCICL